MSSVDQLSNESDDEISVGCPSPLVPNEVRGVSTAEPEDPSGMERLTTSAQETPSQQDPTKPSGVRSFSILDILNHRPSGPAAQDAQLSEDLSASKSKIKERHRRRSSPTAEEQLQNAAARIVRPWDYPQFVPAGFLHPARCLTFPAGPMVHHPGALVSPLGLAAHAPAAFGFHALHRSPYPFAGLGSGPAVLQTPNRASSLSPYSGSSDVHDTDVDGDDISTSGSTSGSPLTGSPPSSNPNAASLKTEKGHSKQTTSSKSSHHSQSSANGSPLDALFQMTSKTFDANSGDSSGGPGVGGHGGLLSSRQQLKKKRKSRTAFTNHQIFELEKRFLYQKYLSPADRDEIALSLGLSNAQVITWFQNRRAKLKRDMEELKKDVESAKILATHKGFVGSMAEMTLLQKKAEEFNKSISARD